MSHSQPCPVVFLAMQPQFLESMHSLSHPSVHATQHMVGDHFLWHGMQRGEVRWTHGCIPCPKNKVSRHYGSHVLHNPVLEELFSHVHIDLTGPLPSSHGFTHLSMCTDRASCWLQAIPLFITTYVLQVCAHKGLCCWVGITIWCALHILSNWGPQFSSL